MKCHVIPQSNKNIESYCDIYHQIYKSSLTFFFKASLPWFPEGARCFCRKFLKIENYLLLADHPVRPSLRHRAPPHKPFSVNFVLGDPSTFNLKPSHPEILCIAA